MSNLAKRSAQNNKRRSASIRIPRENATAPASPTGRHRQRAIFIFSSLLVIFCGCHVRHRVHKRDKAQEGTRPQGGRSVFMHRCGPATEWANARARGAARGRFAWAPHCECFTSWALPARCCAHARPLFICPTGRSLLRSSSASGQPSTGGRGSILHRDTALRWR